MLDSKISSDIEVSVQKIHRPMVRKEHRSLAESSRRRQMLELTASRSRQRMPVPVRSLEGPSQA